MINNMSQSLHHKNQMHEKNIYFIIGTGADRSAGIQQLWPQPCLGQ